MNNPIFEDYEGTLKVGGSPIRVTVSAAALHGLWGEGSGPQDAAGLFEANRALFEEIVADKLVAGANADDLLRIDDVDLDI
jgi:hypothetical protein